MFVRVMRAVSFLHRTARRVNTCPSSTILCSCFTSSTKETIEDRGTVEFYSSVIPEIPKRIPVWDNSGQRWIPVWDNSDLEYDDAGFEEGEVSEQEKSKYLMGGLGKAKPGMEILFVKITENRTPHVNDEGQIGIYGRVAVRGLSRRNYIYKRERDNCEYVKVGDSIQLTGPRRQGICVLDPVLTEVNLIAKGTNKSEDKLLCRDYVEMRYNTIQTFRSKYGAVELKFVYFRRAVEANVSIQCCANCGGIFRKLVAHICSSEVQHEVLLFDCSLTNTDASFHHDGRIHLPRSILAVPFLGELLLEVDIGANDNSVSCTKHKFCFFPKGFDIEETMQIPTEFGEIFLKVTWSNL